MSSQLLFCAGFWPVLLPGLTETAWEGRKVRILDTLRVRRQFCSAHQGRFLRRLTSSFHTQQLFKESARAGAKKLCSWDHPAPGRHP